jgi:hypothetical protein
VASGDWGVGCVIRPQDSEAGKAELEGGGDRFALTKAVLRAEKSKKGRRERYLLDVEPGRSGVGGNKKGWKSPSCGFDAPSGARLRLSRQKKSNTQYKGV